MQHGAGPQSGLVVSSHKRDGFIIVNAEGELDYRSASALRRGLTTAWAAPGISALVLDLSAVAFCDSVGLSELISALRHSRDTGLPLRVVGVQGTVLRILTITGLHESFDIYDDLDAALGRPGASGGPGPGGESRAAQQAADRHTRRDSPPAVAEWRSLPPDPGDLIPAT
ncbi:STAS domain-containing protein [Sphaerisporangium aureirubrum]|uniref:Anti-sigma factor antagonist n=1 Tax=Sphaerisporangium aureirubrum TaxID=1544736 RepID=A0ABW1NWL1_9ACTN